MLFEGGEYLMLAVQQQFHRALQQLKPKKQLNVLVNRNNERMNESFMFTILTEPKKFHLMCLQSGTHESVMDIG